MMSNKPIKILLVEDNPRDAHLVKEMLADADTIQFELAHIDQLSKALEYLSKASFDIILLDLSLPDRHGLDTVIQIRNASPTVPIVVMSGLGDEELAIKAVQEGAQDYLVKGEVESNLLVRSIRYAIERKQSEEALRKAYDNLEIRIQERTAELVKANRALQESEKKYRMLIEQASDGIFILDKEGNIMNSNSMACQMLGYTREELLRLNIRNLIPEEDIAAVPLRINELLAGEKVVIERRFRQKNRILVSVEISAKMLEDGRLQIIVRDLTERKKVEKALQSSQASLAEAQRIAHIGNWDWDIQTNELHWSDEIFRIFGLTPQQFGATYDTFLNSVHPDDREFVKRAVNEALYGKPYNIDHRIVLPDGTVRIVHEQGEVTFGESGEPIRMIGTVQDITERKENELRVIVSERLAALGQMASGIAHEINNPLAAIAACAEGLLNRIKKGRVDPELFNNYLEIIGEEVKRSKNITTGMLSFVREKTYEKNDVNINDILEKTIELIHFQGRLKEVKVIKNYKVIPVIQRSEGELKQVFLSIILNSLDAMEDRGMLILETGVEDNKVFIKVADSGSGIPSDLIGRIFDPFFTTKSEKGGTGLGLSIANKLITDSNGTIEVTSPQGKGTVFKINLPM